MVDHLLDILKWMAILVGIFALVFGLPTIGKWVKRMTYSKERQMQIEADREQERKKYWADRAAEGLKERPYVIPKWATHEIELVEDYEWFHMLPTVIRKGTISHARMINGAWESYINDGLTCGVFTFPDDIVHIRKHLV